MSNAQAVRLTANRKVLGLWFLRRSHHRSWHPDFGFGMESMVWRSFHSLCAVQVRICEPSKHTDTDVVIGKGKIGKNWELLEPQNRKPWIWWERFGSERKIGFWEYERLWTLGGWKLLSFYQEYASGCDGELLGDLWLLCRQRMRVRAGRRSVTIGPSDVRMRREELEDGDKRVRDESPIGIWRESEIKKHRFPKSGGYFFIW